MKCRGNIHVTVSMGVHFVWTSPLRRQKTEPEEWHREEKRTCYSLMGGVCFFLVVCVLEAKLTLHCLCLKGICTFSICTVQQWTSLRLYTTAFKLMYLCLWYVLIVPTLLLWHVVTTGLFPGVTKWPCGNIWLPGCGRGQDRVGVPWDLSLRWWKGVKVGT